ncbi:MAG: tRNA (adenine-N1)-methyltransferase [Hadesarchaea archaeon]|nr:tRNA (adenine-N1)-methyltransferase [Hadesarchaea archaeon]
MNLGDRVLLLDEQGKTHLIRIQEEEFHTNKGIIKLEDIANKEPGDKIESHTGEKFTILEPSMADQLKKIKRDPQIVQPKDASQIIAHTGIGPASKIVDAGTGSGALAIFLGNIVRPNGKVYSYEIREDFIEIAKENIDKVGLEEIIEVKNQDIYEGINESDLDLIVLDLPNPEKVLKHAEEALKPGGYLSAYSPCIEPIKRLYEEFRNFKFQNYKTIECLVRELDVKENCTRPKTRMTAHTGYLTFARRI